VDAFIKRCEEYTNSNYVIPPKDLELIYACGLVEIVHNGSLMCDDIEDKSIKRRGDFCTYIKFGEDVAVNAGTLMYYSPLMKLNHFVECPQTRSAIQQVYSEEMNNIHFG
jgi:geranylgeranyl pyrophosphate synthase